MNRSTVAGLPRNPENFVRSKGAAVLRFRHPLLLAVVLSAALPCYEGRAAEVTQAMNEEEPRFSGVRNVTLWSDKLKPLWLSALAQPEAELKRRVAQMVVRAQRSGMPDLDGMVPALVAEFEAPQNSLIVRLAIAQALIALRAEPDLLWKHAQAGGLDMAEVVEPALASWDYQPAVASWLARLENAGGDPRHLMLAIEGARFMEVAEAAPSLARLAVQRHGASDIRLAAARAVGEVKRQGLEDDAQLLLSRDDPASLLDRLIAALLLRHHSGEPTQSLLLQLAADAEPAVQAPALARLLEIDPMLVEPLNEQLAKSPDAKVRDLAAHLLFGQATTEAVALLGELLDDPHPGIRRYAQESLISLAAKGELDRPVRAAAMKMLATDRPRGLEEAALVVGALDHEPAADRLLELLEFDHPKVMVAAGWALRKLQVPETAEPIFEKLQRDTKVSLELAADLKRRRDEDPLASMEIPDWSALYKQLAQLIQALGHMRYKEAAPLLKTYLPKPPLPGLADPPPVETTAQPELRASAVWTLGYLYEDDPQDDLAKTLQQRMTDRDPVNSESGLVQQMSAVALGRMDHRASLPVLRKTYESGVISVNLCEAAAWAIERMTGEKLPPLEPETIERSVVNWYIEPLEY